MPIAIFQISKEDSKSGNFKTEDVKDLCQNVLDKVLSGLSIPDENDHELRIVIGDKTSLTVSFTVGGYEYEEGVVFSPKEDEIRAVIEDIKQDLPEVPVVLETYSGSVFKLIESEDSAVEIEDGVEAEGKISEAEFTVVLDRETANDWLNKNGTGAGSRTAEGAPPSAEDEMLPLARTMIDGAEGFVKNPKLRVKIAELAETPVAVELMTDQEVDPAIFQQMRDRIQNNFVDQGYEGTIWLMSSHGRTEYS